jgi:hypothetical protein
MQPFQDLLTMRQATLAFVMAYGQNLPADVAPIFSAAVSNAMSGPPAEGVTAIAETIFANQAEITDAPTLGAARTLAGACAGMAAVGGYYSDSLPGRYAGIWAAMGRNLGETPPLGSAWPEASADPDPNPAFAPAAPEVEPEASISTGISTAASSVASLSTSASSGLSAATSSVTSLSTSLSASVSTSS